MPRPSIASRLRFCVALGVAAAAAVAQDAAASRAESSPTSRATTVLYSTRGDERLHLADARDLRPLASIDVGLGAHELAVSSDGRYAVGSAYGGPGAGHRPADKRIVVVDLARRAVHRTIDLGALKRPNDLAFLPGTTTFLATVEDPPRLLRVDAATGEFVALDVTRRAGHMLALTADAKTACVSHVVPGALTFVDVAAWTVSGVCAVPEGAEGVAVSPDGGTAWIGCNRAERLVAVDVRKREVVRDVPCAGFPLRVRVSPDGATVAVSCPKSGEVALHAAADPERATRIDATDPDAEGPAVPTSLSFAPDGKTLAVMCDGAAPAVILIDVATKKIVARGKPAGPIADALVVADVVPPR
jgi:DNA-binding beta-propeller fold protein YncE